MDEKILFEILKYTVIFIISVFLPKKVTYLIRSIFSYYFNNLLKYWLLLTIEIVIFCYVYLNRSTILFEGFNNIKNYLLILFITTIIINLIYLLRTYFTKNKIFFSVYPSYTIKENEFIVNDIQSDKINSIIESKIKLLKPKFYVFRNNIIEIKLLSIPEFIPIILGFDGFLNFIKKRLNKENPIALYIQKDLLDNTIETYFYYDQNQFINATINVELNKINQKICRDKEKSIDEKIESIFHLYLFVNSQSFLDFTLDIKSYNETFNILNDLKEQIPFIESDLKSYKIDDDLIIEFVNSWSGIIMRYFSIVYLEKNEVLHAVDCIIQANNINPYFPESNYTTAKNQYINKYLLEVLPKMKSKIKETNSELDYSKISVSIKNIQNKIDFEYTTPNYQILIEIIKRNGNNDKFLHYIEKSLEELIVNETNIFTLIFIAESYKRLPLGKNIYNNIYVNRIPKIIEILKKAISIDNDFDFLHLRIGILLFIYGFNHSEAESEKALKYMNEHAYIYDKYGLR
ncbi:MAG: hypothetical protein ACOH1X_11215 [Kaistella sp.]